MTKLKTTAILAICVLATACGTQFLYNRLDFIIPWYIGDYVSLERPQKRFLDDKLRPLLRWHREQELARYLRLLQQVEQDLGGEVTAQTTQRWRDELTRAWERVKSRALPPLLELGGELSDAQMREFIAALRDKQRELEEEHLERDETAYRDEIRAEFRDNFEDYLGPLTAPQRVRIDRAATEMRRVDHIWLRRRAERTDALAAILQNRRPGWQDATRATLARFSNTRAPAQQEIFLHNREVIQRAIADVLNLRTAAQSQHLAQEIADLREDIEGLIGQGFVVEARPQG